MEDLALRYHNVPFLLAFFVLPLMLSACGEGEAEGAKRACTIIELDDGATAIRCPDDSEFIVANGRDGAEGAKGQKGADGADGLEGPPGADGLPGADGQDAEPCNLTKNPNGSHTITCGSTSVVIDGPCEDGFPGDVIAGDELGLLLLQVSNCTRIRGSLILSGLEGETLPGYFNRITTIDEDLRLDNSQSLLQVLALPNLRKVGGNVIIAGSTALRLVDLPKFEEVGKSLLLWALSALEEVDFSALGKVAGELRIQYSDELGLLELQKLTEVGSHFILEENLGLETVTLPSLREVGGGLFFHELPALSSLSASMLVSTGDLRIVGADELRAVEFQKLTEAGYLTIWKNAGLKTISLPSLEQVENIIFFNLLPATETVSFPVLRSTKLLTFYQLDALNEIVPFPALETVEEWLTIAELPKLTKVGGFPSLTVVGGIQFGQNPLLESIPSFSALSEIQGMGEGNEAEHPIVLIIENDKLTSLGDLGSVSLIEGHVKVADNPLLPHGVAEALFDGITVTGNKNICSNLGGPSCE